MIQRKSFEPLNVDLSRVQSYIPVALIFIEGFLPVVVISLFSDAYHIVFAVTVLAVMAIKSHATMRNEVFLFDTVPIAIELIGMSLFVGFMNIEQARQIWVVFAVIWCIISSLYKMTLSPHDRFYSPWTFVCTIVMLLILSLSTPISVTFQLPKALSISRAGVYAVFSIIDNYTMAIYSNKRDGVVQRTEMTLFLHGGVLIASDLKVLSFCLVVLFLSQSFGIFFMHKTNNAKKNDDQESLSDYQKSTNTYNNTPPPHTLAMLNIPGVAFGCGAKNNGSTSSVTQSAFAKPQGVRHSLPVELLHKTSPTAAGMTPNPPVALQEEFQKALALAQA